ncbi:hypothetical protein AB6A40_006149 [Gnathostoma spinigerum]|uniref:Secreted protein n=1 Tax=Gnathostoma spinigerum TaxID=75299 RepID=A0ABD6ET62_9BILA
MQVALLYTVLCIFSMSDATPHVAFLLHLFFTVLAVHSKSGSSFLPLSIGLRGQSENTSHLRELKQHITKHSLQCRCFPTSYMCEFQSLLLITVGFYVQLYIFFSMHYT